MRKRSSERRNHDIQAFVEHIFFIRDLQLMIRDALREYLRDPQLLAGTAALDFKDFGLEIVQLFGHSDLDTHTARSRPGDPLDRIVVRERRFAGFPVRTADVQDGKRTGHNSDVVPIDSVEPVQPVEPVEPVSSVNGPNRLNRPNGSNKRSSLY